MCALRSWNKNLRDHRSEEYFKDLLERQPKLTALEKSLFEAYALITASFSSGGKLLTCGNGGSAADADHIVGELMKGFILPRPVTGQEAAAIGPLASRLQRALPAISLPHQVSFATAFSNDEDASMVFAQQVFGLGKPGDLLLALSTSGNSRNVVYAAEVAEAIGMKVLGFTGEGGGALEQHCAVCLKVPETETYKIQELHESLYHILCAMVESYFFSMEE